jgi:hypothetical protein
MHRLAWPLALSAALAFARDAGAQPPAPDLMQRLAASAASIETIYERASYMLDGSLERLDGDGKPDSVKAMRARIVHQGKRSRTIVVKYTEDGEDKTEEARKKQHEDDEKSDEDTKKDKLEIEMPFGAKEQSHYAFDVVETDAADPARVRITFVPTAPSEKTIEGSAWVDTRTATLVSAGFKLSEPPRFVDWVHVTMEFREKTDLGAAISKIAFDGRGGFLFFRKRFRGSATLSDYQIAH